VIELARDKYRTYLRLRDAGHAVPETWLASERVGPSEFPLIVKPRQGRGSRDVERVTDGEELAAYLEHTEREPDELLLQEFLPGEEYTTSVVGTADGELLGVVPKEAIEKDGSTVVGATREAPAVVASCRAVFDTLEPAGPMNVQQILDEDGTPRTIEINPRFSSTSCLTVAAGVDEFDLLVRDALGDPVEPVEDYEPERYLLRYDDHLFTGPDDVEPLLENSL